MIVAVDTLSSVAPLQRPAGSGARGAALAESATESETDSGDSNLPREDQPVQGPVVSDQRLTVSYNQHERIPGCRSEGPLAAQTADTWFAHESRTSATAEPDVRPAGGPEATVLDQRALALALTGFVGTFQGRRTEYVEQRRKQPKLAACA